jgi:hypothetical protein
MRMAGRLVVLVAAVAATGALAVAGSALTRAPVSAGPTVTVYKSPTCQCCAKWVDHLRAAGFTVLVHDTSDLAAVMAQNGVPPQMASCHTAKVGGYVIEGHVPADLIAKALKEHPAIAGLAVPGMVIGSPGMEGGAAQQYDVVAWTAGGQTSVYAHR